MVFMFASTNLVVELGVVLLILMGWQFALAEFIGGPIMIALLALVGGVLFPAWLVNDAERHRADLRVGTAITEGTANFLVNRRMNKSQQMRSLRRGADLLLQVRCAVYNGTLGSGFGQKFQPANDPRPTMATAA